MTTFQISAEALGTALTIVKPGISQRSLEILKGVSIKVDDGQLRLRTTTLTTSLSVTVPATVTEPGVAVIPYSDLSQFVGVLDKQSNLTIAVDKKARVTTARANVTLDCYDADEYPTEETLGDVITSVPAESLATAARMVIPAVAEDDTRPVLSAMLFEWADGLTLAAADGYVLHCAKLMLPATGSPNMLIPLQSVKTLVSMLDPKGEDVTIHSAGQNRFAFRQGDKLLVTGIIDGTFPNYKTIIPASVIRSFTANVREWHRAVQVASILADRSSSQLHIKVPSGEGQLDALFSMQAESLLNVDATPGDEIAIIFNYRFLSDLLAELPSNQTATFGFNSPTSPGKITLNADGIEFTGIIMPMQTR